MAEHVCIPCVSRAAIAWPCWHSHCSHLGKLWAQSVLVSQEHGADRGAEEGCGTMSTCSRLVVGVGCEVVMVPCGRSHVHTALPSD